MSAKDRVQGMESRLADLTLHDGKKLALEIGGGLVPTPTLKRTIQGASSVSLQIYDPDLSFLQSVLLVENFDAEIDGLHFRYLGASKSERTLTLTLEDRWVSILREARGPKKVFARRGQKNEVTRAEFIKLLVNEAAPNLKFICPQLHEKQPIKTASQAKGANQEAKERREPGIGAAKHLTVDGAPASPAQVELGETAIRIADSVHAPFRVQVALIAALIDESSMGAASGNVLQALGSGGAPIGSPAEEINGFLTGKPQWTGTSAIGYYKAHPDAEYFRIAQEVQKSGAGESSGGAANYGKFGDEARAWVEAFGGEGGEGDGTATVTEPFTFEVAKKEGYWEAIQRLAKEVNWRAFIVGNHLYFIDEEELSRGMVRLAIDPDTPGIPPANVDFDFNRNKEVTEVTLNKVPVKQWKPPPGSVVTLAGYGPASLGFGDAPKKKGQRIGLSPARNAQTGEGRGRYIIVSIESPLTESSDARTATIKLRKPTAPLPEPASETKSISGINSSAVGNKTVERMLAAMERAAEKNKPYVWGGEDPNTGVDCSGAVSFALRVGGFMEGRTDTKGLASFGEAGPGEFITIYDHANTGNPQTEHTAIEIAGVVFESGGGSENSNPNGGLGKVTSGATDFLKQFEIKRHPKGY